MRALFFSFTPRGGTRGRFYDIIFPGVEPGGVSYNFTHTFYRKRPWVPSHGASYQSHPSRNVQTHAPFEACFHIYSKTRV